ncbi:MAG: hypothetical protein ACUVWN_06705 [bacterium]
MLDKLDSFDRKVPSVNHVRTQCKVRIYLKDKDGNELGRDTSDNYFTITP